jgi:hypothetical protein
MSKDLPVACSLSATQLPERLAQIAELSRDAFVAQDRQGRLRFRASARTRARLEALVAAESECCAFLALDLNEDGGHLLLTIDAPPEGREVADALADAFAGRPVLT